MSYKLLNALSVLICLVIVGTAFSAPVAVALPVVLIFSVGLTLATILIMRGKL